MYVYIKVIIEKIMIIYDFTLKSTFSKMAAILSIFHKIFERKYDYSKSGKQTFKSQYVI